MRKRGFTLIEVVAVMSITLVLMSITLKLSNIPSKIINTIKVKSILYDVSNLISFGKHYCFTNEKRGRIEINKSAGVIKFIDENISGQKGVIRNITLPRGYSFLENFIITISVNGVVSGNTINVKDVEGKYHKITIGVGVDTITIYNEE